MKKKDEESEETVKSELIIAAYFAEHERALSNVDYCLSLNKRQQNSSKVVNEKNEIVFDPTFTSNMSLSLSSLTCILSNFPKS